MPTTEFPDRDELLSTTKEWAGSQGYAVVIARSRFNRLWLKCDRGGTYENRRNLTPDQRKRKRSDSRLLGCPFRMLASVKKDGRWRVETEVSEHNHPASEDLSAHPTLRRMSKDQLQKVFEMLDARKSPAETVEELKRAWPEIKVLTRDVYNARKKYKTQREEAKLLVSGHGQSNDNVIYNEGEYLGSESPNEDPNEDAEVRTPVSSKSGPHANQRQNRKPVPMARASQLLDQTLDPRLQDSNISASHANESEDQARQTLPPYISQPQISAPSPSTTSDHVLTDGMRDDAGSYHTPKPRSYTQRTQSNQNARQPTSHMMDSSGMESGILSRIDLIEKEQREQKQILAQILGAVKAMSTSSASTIHEET